MKNYIKIYTLLAIFMLMLITRGNAQLAAYNDNKEKIYIHTNHVFFKPGEDLFFKIYLVNAKNQQISSISNVVFVDVLAPSGNILETMNYRIDQGYAEGHYQFKESASGGMYKLRAYTTWMRNEKEPTWFTKELTVQKVISPRVLMKLDFPRKGYGPGDSVVAAYSIRDLSDKAIPYYQIKYAVSLAGKTTTSGTAKTDKDGKADIAFKLPADLNTQDGILNITVKYGAYTEAISRSIPITLNKIDLQFMPEGGTFVENISTNVAFKAVNEYGKPADVKGEILDNAGMVITTFVSYHDGMGQFSFTPAPGKVYKARLLSPSGIQQQFDLPATTPQGLVMNIIRKENILRCRINTTQEMKIRLTGQSKNDVYYDKEIILQKGEQLIDIDPVNFPSGIARFTISDLQHLPLAERIIFLHPDRTLQVKLTADKSMYTPREKVTLYLKTLDEKGTPVPSNFSLSVIDDKLWSLADDKQDHILSWLLMSSELHGEVEEPQFYFRQQEKKAIPSLDLVMLTHGYRYFDYIDYIETTGKPKYNPDLNTILIGRITDELGRPVESIVYLISSTNQYRNCNVIEQATGKDGLFLFTDITPALDYHLIARSTRRKGHVTINIIEQGTGNAPIPARKTKDPFSDNDRLPPPLLALNKGFRKDNNAAAADKTKAENFMNDQSRALQEVVVIGYNKDIRKEATAAIVVTKADAINIHDITTALQGSATGINITKATATPQNNVNVQIRGMASISGQTQPLIILNGVPVSNLETILDPADVENIIILNDASATAIYGSRGANGVISITTRYKLLPNKTVINLDRTYYYASKLLQTGNKSYTATRRFYAPKYYSPEIKERNDFRETIYWNPVIQTDKNGDAKIEFYNSDATTTFRAIAEGIGYNGKLGRTEMTYAVQSPINVDVKIPPYMAMGDNALLPVVIRNSTNQVIRTNVKAILPDNMIAGKFADTVTLQANNAAQVLIPVKAIAAVTGNIGFVVNSDNNTEKISLPISVGNNGFPVITTISGNKSTNTEFRISDMMAGSLTTELKVFDNFEGQLLNDIESMLREPHGCFEQTSSSTYPNIYILKYLRSTGKSNPEIEEKALAYIRNGYQRLIGFETAKHGFEWFGKTPAHEALTAYGLLEFTDMQEFVNVDKNMLNRTKDFLLSRRDGEGNFTLAKGGYGAFASVPNDIANIYIVYALSEAGLSSEIKPEYEHAVKQALASNDAYQLATMAIAASNMKNDKDFTALMRAVKNTNLQAATSVTNSRATSLRVETMALYAIALTREKSPDLSTLANIISSILSCKTYNGYGSTQATILTLRALVEYKKLIGHARTASTIEIRINNEITQTGTNNITNIKEGDNTFSIKYADENNAIPYQLELGYYTLLPPDSPEAELNLSTALSNNSAKVGETVRLSVEVKNIKNDMQPMSIAKIGIPAGLTVQSWQLKELIEKNQVAYYEIFDNYLVLYWMGFAAGETKKVHLDLKAEIAGTYRGKASTAYLYYTPEYKHWNPGTAIVITP